ncbi:L-lactate dehydrogenase [Streptococcus sp. DD13]|uniref:L-lactate dehydrogenase n=1 Tax=Streptococcus sp. DD13 TaxID=1777881 RepID=UPI00079A0DCC|nr:L-lactate dehydrogenase [Streptococcus sp. DD13]KXT78131.1 L-lactate dehydrogenase [Streptococcus sp. DD13]
MGRKIGIIGIGHVGATLAHSLILSQTFDQYVLIDTNVKKVEADALDFRDTAANSGQSVRIIVNDYQALADADIVISTLGDIKSQANNSDDRFAELPFTSQQVIQVSADLKASGFQGILLVVTNPVDAVTQLYQKYTGFPKERVIGSGTLLDTARMKRAVGERLALDPSSVSGYNLGEHGNSQFVAWSQVRVKGRPITELLSQEELASINHESLRGGHTVFFGKFYTNFGIAAAAKRLILAVLEDRHEELPVSHYVADYGTYLGYPAIVGAQGIEESLMLTLTDEEKAKLAHSAQTIKENTKKGLEDSR